MKLKVMYLMGIFKNIWNRFIIYRIDNMLDEFIPDDFEEEDLVKICLDCVVIGMSKEHFDRASTFFTIKLNNIIGDKTYRLNYLVYKPTLIVIACDPDSKVISKLKDDYMESCGIDG